MWTNDDLIPRTRVQQVGTDLHRRVMGLNLDALLRWTLVVNVTLVSVFSALAVLQFAWGAVSSVVMTALSVARSLIP